MAPIHNAIQAGNLQRVREILNQDPSAVNSRDQMGRRPLSIAISNRKPHIVNEILNRNPPQSHLNGGLIKAAMSGHVNMVRKLLNKGANINHKDGGVYSSLSWAARQRHPHVVNELLKRGAARNSEALREAIVYSQVPIIRMLVRAGTPVNQQIRNMHKTNVARNALENALLNRRRQPLGLVGLHRRNRRTNERVNLPPELVRTIMGMAFRN
jgi:ankyrin repeat protein